MTSTQRTALHQAIVEAGFRIDRISDPAERSAADHVLGEEIRAAVRRFEDRTVSLDEIESLGRALDATRTQDAGPKTLSLSEREFERKQDDVHEALFGTKPAA